MYNNGNSSKNVTGASVVDGTLENADFADNTISGDKIDAGIISNFQSTGIDDRLPTGKVLTLSTTGIDVTGTVTCDTTMSVAGAGTEIQIDDTDNTPLIRFRESGTTKAIITTAAGGNLRFLAGGSTERMKITSTGRMIIASAATVDESYIQAPVAGSSLGAFGSYSGSSSTRKHMRFENPNGVVGSIHTSGSSTAYNTSSDYRLKENVVPMTGSIDRLKALKPSNFNFIADAATTVDGFLAHEAGAVVPEAVSGEKDAMTDIGNVTNTEGEIVQENIAEPTELEEGQTWTKTGEQADYQGIDQSKLVPLLVSALQEAITRIETLESA